MKKMLCLCFSILLLCGCGDGGRNVVYELNEGDTKLTITRDYIIVDSLYWIDNFNNPVWKFKQTVSRSDTAACKELFERLLERK